MPDAAIKQDELMVWLRRYCEREQVVVNANANVVEIRRAAIDPDWRHVAAQHERKSYTPGEC